MTFESAPSEASADLKAKKRDFFSFSFLFNQGATSIASFGLHTENPLKNFCALLQVWFLTVCYASSQWVKQTTALREDVPTNLTKQGKKTKEDFSIKASKITFYRQKFLLKFLDQAELVPVSEGLQVAAEEMRH